MKIEIILPTRRSGRDGRIQRAAHTGKIGDGKISCCRDTAIRIRTQEEGDSRFRMN